MLDEKFSPEELNQTDFGRLHFNVPNVRHEPTSVAELADVLKRENARGRRVTVRNTGHSVNGQTLTGGVQVSIGKIKNITFDEERRQVTVGSGNSWDEMLKAIHFPKYCPPVFPQNPDQQIHMTGTAAVGGIGIYSSRAGGLWNHISEITLVTMTGEIVKCSPIRESDLFYYSLGGFGRIGVIAEMTINVAPSASETLITVLTHHNAGVIHQHLKNVLACADLDGVIFQRQLTHAALLEKAGFRPMSIIAMKDIAKGENVEATISMLRDVCHPDMSLFVIPDQEHGIDFTFHHRTMSKQELVYYYPRNPNHQLSLAHPWGDFVVPFGSFEEFNERAGRLILERGIAPYLTRESVFHDHISLDWFGGYMLRNVSAPQNRFPLSLELQNSDEYSVAFGIQPAVPRELIPPTLELMEKLTDLAYQMGGKKYLYGVHSLTREQVERQFGRDTIKAWQRIKDRTDPNHLLNIGVIEHLDE